MESREGWSAWEKIRFICLLKDGDGQRLSKFGVGPEHRARQPLGLSMLNIAEAQDANWS